MEDRADTEAVKATVADRAAMAVVDRADMEAEVTAVADTAVDNSRADMEAVDTADTKQTNRAFIILYFKSQCVTTSIWRVFHIRLRKFKLYVKTTERARCLMLFYNFVIFGVLLLLEPLSMCKTVPYLRNYKCRKIS